MSYSQGIRVRVNAIKNEAKERAKFSPEYPPKEEAGDILRPNEMMRRRAKRGELENRALLDVLCERIAVLEDKIEDLQDTVRDSL